MTRVRPGRPSRGFTLIELLTTIVVMTILVGFAMPSFTGFMQRNALNAEAGALASALGTARANAISHNTWVTVAPVNNDWQNGWTVCLNPARSADCSSGQTILLQHAQLPRNLTISFTGTPQVSVLSYSPVGYTRTLTDAMMSAQILMTLGSDSQARLIDISQLGRVRVCTPDTAQPTACKA